MNTTKPQTKPLIGQPRSNVGLGILCKHKGLGNVWLTDDCLAMQAMNPDPTSMFVEHDGEVKEVTRSMVVIHNI